MARPPVAEPRELAAARVDDPKLDHEAERDLRSVLTAEGLRRDLTVDVDLVDRASRARSGVLAARPAGRWGWPIGIEPMLIAPGLAEDLDAIAVLSEALDEGDDTGRARKRGAPLLECQVRRDDRRALLVAAADDVVQQGQPRVNRKANILARRGPTDPGGYSGEVAARRRATTPGEALTQVSSGALEAVAVRRPSGVDHVRPPSEHAGQH